MSDLTNNMNTCFILTHIPNPRINKRITEFLKVGEVSVICVRRKGANIWKQYIDNVDYYILDMEYAPSSQIIKRAIHSKKFQKFAGEILKQKKIDVCYVGDLDALLIVKRIKRKDSNIKVVFEVSDLREIYIEKPQNVIKSCMRSLLLKTEKKAFSYVNNLIVTSPKFYDAYYKNLISRNKMLYIPNSPNMKYFKDYSKKKTGGFTIGFIGGIRYLEQMKNLVDAAAITNCNVLFAGAGATTKDYEEIQEYCKDKPFVTFSGQYDYSTDIAMLYGKVDCVYAVYDADNPNVRIALPNKLYESIVCHLPIIVAKKTYLSELVERWGVGVSVDHHNLKDLVEAISKLKNGSACSDIDSKCGIIEDDICCEHALSKLIESFVNGETI